MQIRPLPLLLGATLLSGLATGQRPAGTARLLVDINQRQIPAAVNSEFVRVGAWSWFVATSDGRDRLFRTGGTPQSTELFLDPGATGGADVQIDSLAAVGARLFFAVVIDGVSRLWVSDGTSAGTRPTGPSVLDVALPFAFGDRLVFFGGEPGGNGSEPWISDGTVAGTFELVDAVPGPSGSSPSTAEYAVVPSVTGGGDRLWITTRQVGGRPSLRLWSSDGTSAGTTFEAELSDALIIRGPVAVGPGRVLASCLTLSTTLRNRVYRIEEGRGATELAMPPSVTSPVLRQMISFDGRTLIDASDGVLAIATDGTAAGTIEIGLLGATKDGTTVFLRSDGQGLFLGYQSGADWRLGLLSRGSDVVQDLGRLPGRPGPSLIAAGDGVGRIGNELIMVIGEQAERALFAVAAAPGAAAGQLAGFDIQGGLGGSFGRVLFARRGAAGEILPYVTDGSAAGTRLLIDLAGSQVQLDSSPENFVAYGDRTVFFAWDSTTGYAPWITDGTSGGTHRLTSRGALPSAPVYRSILEVGDELWGVRPQGSPNPELAIDAYDGSVGGVRLVATLQSGVAAPRCEQPTAFGSGMLFRGNLNGTLGVYDLRADGQISLLLATVKPVESLIVLGEQAVVTLFPDAASPREVWLTDGTAGGTRQLGTAGTISRTASVGVAFDDRVWLHTDEGVFVVDGNGVTPFPALPPGLSPYVAGSRLFGVSADSVWATDGTVAGTTQIAVGGNLPGPDPRRVTVQGERLLFVRNRSEVWISDGSAAGTTQIADSGSANTQLWAVGQERVYFAGNPVGSPRGLFVTDGTAVGTRYVQPLPVIENVSRLFFSGAVSGGRLYLAVDDPAVGLEPFVLDPGGSVDELGRPCSGGGTAVPTLRADRDTALGAMVTLRGAAEGAAVAWLLLGPPASRAQALPGSRCEARVDLNGATVIGPLATGPNGGFQTSFNVPNSTALLGLRAATQALFATGRGPLAIDASAGLLLQIGR